MSIEVLTVMNFVMDCIVNLVFTVFLILAAHTREMTTRKKYNLERIYHVEIDKTEIELAKLVPFHILSGIKNDQRIFDQLDNVTMLCAELVFLDKEEEIPSISAYQKAINQTAFLSRVFCKFD